VRALVDAASFAWFSYGMMSMTNTIYYVNKFYWDFIIRYDTGILAFRTLWGWSEFIRVFANFTTWGVTLILWAMTFAPMASTHELFALHTKELLFLHVARLFGVLIMKILSFFMDSYSEEYQYYSYEIMWGGEDSDTAIDYSLELSTFIGMLIAYPLMQHSVKNLKTMKDNGTLDQTVELANTIGAPADEWATNWDNDEIFGL